MSLVSALVKGTIKTAKGTRTGMFKTETLAAKGVSAQDKIAKTAKTFGVSHADAAELHRGLAANEAKGIKQAARAANVTGRQVAEAGAKRIAREDKAGKYLVERAFRPANIQGTLKKIETAEGKSAPSYNNPKRTQKRVDRQKEGVTAAATDARSRLQREANKAAQDKALVNRREISKEHAAKRAMSVAAPVAAAPKPGTLTPDGKRYLGIHPNSPLGKKLSDPKTSTRAQEHVKNVNKALGDVHDHLGNFSKALGNIANILAKK